MCVGSELANDVYQVALEHGLDVDGVATVVNLTEHERLRDGALTADEAACIPDEELPHATDDASK